MKTEWQKILRKMITLILMILMLSLSASALAEDLQSQKLNTYYSLAVGFIGKENYDKGMQYLDSALELCSEESNAELYADLHLKKGCIFTIRKEYEDAIKELDEALRVQPNLEEAWLVKLQVYNEMENTEETVKTLEKYVELSGDKSLYESLALLYVQNGDRKKAIEYYRRMAEAEAKDAADVPYVLAVYEMGVEMYEEALANLKSCEPNLEKYPGLNYNTAVCEMVLGHFEEAIAKFTESIEKEQFKSDALYNRAICYMSLDNYQAALEDFTAYIDMPVTEETVDNTQNMEQKRKPDIAWYYRGICEISVKAFEQAAADFTVCIENGINADESLFNRGLSYLQSDRFVEAKTDFTTCIEKGILPDESLFYRAYAERYLNQYEEALADLTVCIEHEYNLGQAYQQRAQVYQALNDQDHYLEDLEASLAYLEE